MLLKRQMTQLTILKREKESPPKSEKRTSYTNPYNECLGRWTHRIIPGSVWLLVLLLLLLLHLPSFFLLDLQERLRSACRFADIPPARELLLLLLLLLLESFHQFPLLAPLLLHNNRS